MEDNRMGDRAYGFSLLMVFGLMTVLSGTGQAQENATEAERRVREKVGCTENLKQIYEGIQSYRRAHKDLPDWLSDLVPDHLADANAFTCPVTKRTGKVNNYGLDDPKVSTSYLYEFCARPVPNSIQGGSTRTMKEWKQRQMGLLGSTVPMLRCHQHSPILNLAFDGTVYEGPVSWEAEFKDVVSTGQLTPKALFADDTPGNVVEPAILVIPGRAPGAPSGCLDLSRHYNAALEETWHEPAESKNKYANDLAWLPRGEQTLAGVTFDIRGIVQLGSKDLKLKRYPVAVQGIAVGRAFRTAHVLHGTGWSAPTGTRIGKYVFRYADGEKAELPIVYGKDVRDWWFGSREPPESSESTVAWIGKSAATETRGVSLRLYKSQWQNPRPEATIDSIDFVSSMASPAPFLIAITVE